MTNARSACRTSIIKSTPEAGQRVRQTPGAPLVLVIWFSLLAQKTFPFGGRRARRGATLVSFREPLDFLPLSLSLSLSAPPVSFASGRITLFPSHSPFSYFALGAPFCFSNYKLYRQLTTIPRLVRTFLGESSDNVSAVNTGILESTVRIYKET